jgi:hypothetical protein
MSANFQGPYYELDFGPEFQESLNLISSYELVNITDSTQNLNRPAVRRKPLPSASLLNPSPPSYQVEKTVQTTSEDVTMIEDPGDLFVKKWAFDITITTVFSAVVLALFVFAGIAIRLNGKPVGTPHSSAVLKDISEKVRSH